MSPKNEEYKNPLCDLDKGWHLAVHRPQSPVTLKMHVPVKT
jgi:hypothetical protein